MLAVGGLCLAKAVPIELEHVIGDTTHEKWHSDKGIVAILFK